MAERETEIKHESMKGVIASTGTKISDHERWKRESLNIKRRTTKWVEPRPGNEDDDSDGAGGAFGSLSADKGGE